jgi:uncharacterized damage-inducible protein DinB
MLSPEYVRLMAAYSCWQNGSIFAAGETLGDAERRRDRGAFFGSIHATLNHLLWADRLWLHRLAGTREPDQPDIPSSLHLQEDWALLRSEREATDRALVEWAQRVEPGDLEGELSWYSGAMQANVRRPRWVLVVQLFNHGTHHRGQVHAMLTSAGARPEDTDVPFIRSEHYRWPN